MAGKASRLKAHKEKMKAKRAAKAARKAHYELLRDSDRNRKVKKNKLQQNKKVKNSKHEETFCGNTGCKSCFPSSYKMTDAEYAKIIAAREDAAKMVGSTGC